MRVSVRRAYLTAYLAWQASAQARFPFSPGVDVERVQRRRLLRMAAHAYATVPYYRETMRRLGLRPHDLRTAADLARLPIIERADVQRDPEYYVSSVQPLGRYLLVRSGGSTGAPRAIFHDARSVIESGAYAERQRTIVRRSTGRRLHYREAIIESPFGTTRATQEFLARHLLISPRLAFNRLYLSLLDPPERNLELLKAFRPHVVEGYGSYLELLFPYIHASGEPLDWPKVVLYGSDAMSPVVRRLIADKMGPTVLSVYGAVEALQIGFECEHGLGYHLNVDVVPLRIVGPSGEEQAVGEVGEVIVSNLINRATVLLNYRLGDVASLQRPRCPCGRSLPLLSFIEGRADDWIQSAAGGTLHPQAVRTLFSDAFRGRRQSGRQRREIHSRGRTRGTRLAEPRRRKRHPRHGHRSRHPGERT